MLRARAVDVDSSFGIHKSGSDDDAGEGSEGSHHADDSVPLVAVLLDLVESSVFLL